MNGSPRILAVLLLVAAACGSNDPAQPSAIDRTGSGDSSQTNESASALPTTTLPASTVPASTVPATAVTTITDPSTTTVPATTLPATTAAPGTVPPTAGAGTPMTADELARRLPTVSGYFYSTITQRSVWGLENTSDEIPADALGPDIVSLQDLATTVSRPVFLEGGDAATGMGWVGEVSVFDAGGDTSQLWMDFADRHRVFCLVGPSVEEGFYVSNTVPAKWRAIGQEIVMFGVAEPDGDFGAAWFHDGLIWAVSGWSRSSDFAEALISVQAFTGPEPEQTDADALEGALGDVIVDVPGFELVDPGPAEVLSSLQGLGNCVQHLSLHWVHPAGRKGVAIEIYMVGFAAPSPCDRGAWLIDDLVAEGASLHDINGVPAALSADGTTMIVVPDTGVVVQAYVKNAANLGLFTPVLEAFALTAAAIEI